jgi:hypothetical protein
MSLYPAGHSTRQGQTTTASFTCFFEVEVGGTFQKSSAKRRLIRHAVVCRAEAGQATDRIVMGFAVSSVEPIFEVQAM